MKCFHVALVTVMASSKDSGDFHGVRQMSIVDSDDCQRVCVCGKKFSADTRDSAGIECIKYLNCRTIKLCCCD